MGLAKKRFCQATNICSLHFELLKAMDTRKGIPFGLPFWCQRSSNACGTEGPGKDPAPPGRPWAGSGAAPRGSPEGTNTQYV